VDLFSNVANALQTFSNVVACYDYATAIHVYRSIPLSLPVLVCRILITI